MKAKFYIGVVGFIVLIISCKTRKFQEQQPIITDTIIATQTTAQEVSFPTKNIEWFDGKFDAQVDNDGKKNALKGRVRIKKDSLLWISIKPDIAIIEVFRVLISKDSVKVIDYLNKEYFKGDFNFIQRELNINISFNGLQSIFLGEPYFVLPKNRYQGFKISGEDVYSNEDIAMYTKQRAKGEQMQILFQALWFNQQNQVWRNLYYDPASRVELDLQYTQFMRVDSTLLPQRAAVQLKSEKPPVSFFFDYSKIELNTSFSFPFNIPASYKPMELKVPKN